MTATQRPNLRALRNEAEWLPASLDELLDVRRRLLDAGHPQQLAAGIGMWLAAKAAGEPDLTDSTTRSRYRRILAELGGPDDGRGGRATVRRAIPGYLKAA